MIPILNESLPSKAPFGNGRLPCATHRGKSRTLVLIPSKLQCRSILRGRRSSTKRGMHGKGVILPGVKLSIFGDRHKFGCAYFVGYYFHRNRGNNLALPFHFTSEDEHYDLSLRHHPGGSMTRRLYVQRMLLGSWLFISRSSRRGCYA